MNFSRTLHLLTVGLAVFSMFFGAGNVMFAINVGRKFQSQTPVALVGFLLTAVGLPLLGIVSMLLFHGDYRAFFARAGRWTGAMLCAVSLVVLAPLIAMPRIVALSHTVLVPHLPICLPMFTVLFLLLTYVCTVAKEQILTLLGHWISPALMLSLLALLVAAAVSPLAVQSSDKPLARVVLENALYGYNTLDLIAAVYFGSMVVRLLRRQRPETSGTAVAQALGLQSSCLGLAFLAIIYVGLACLGAKVGHPNDGFNEGEVLTHISRLLLGHWGAVVVAVMVVLACLSTMIALATLFADYLQQQMFVRQVSYGVSLMATLTFTGLIANLGLTLIIELSAPILMVIYPAMIALTTVNFLYKTTGFRPARCIVLSVFFISLYLQQDQLISFWQSVSAIGLGRWS